MPARKKPTSHSSGDQVQNPMPTADGSPRSPASSPEGEIRVHEDEEKSKPVTSMPDLEPQDPSEAMKKDESLGEVEMEDASSSINEEEEDKSEYVIFDLADIRREVQCPICLGIIRKTRTVMDCLHRFCKECIDRSMRLGNNECPACRTHCASRRSLRDDPNYDALIAALYPDIDKYEEEELSLHEEERMRNKKIQAYISETLQRQSEALGRRRSAKSGEAGFMRRSQRNFRSGRGGSRGGSRAASRATMNGSENEEEVLEGNDGNQASPEFGRQKRVRRWSAGRSHPGPERSSAEPEEIANRDLLAWGKNGVRSQNRHGGSSGLGGRSTRVDRVSRLVDHLNSLEEKDDDLEVHLKLVPAGDGGDRVNKNGILERPFLCCRTTLSVNQLAKFVAIQMAVEPEDVEIFMEKGRGDFQALQGQDFIGSLQSSMSSPPFDMVLAYRVRQHATKEGVIVRREQSPPDGKYNSL